MPLLSKNNLAAPAAIASVDCDLVQINENGSTFAAGRVMFVAVEPVPMQVKEQLLPVKSFSQIECCIAGDTARRVIKQMPRDTLFGGLLENVAVEQNDDELQFTTSDGRRKATLRCEAVVAKMLFLRER
jgi:hypothetical protein